MNVVPAPMVRLLFIVKAPIALLLFALERLRLL